MAKLRFAEGMSAVQILSPADITETETKTGFVDLKTINWATLALHFGAITCNGPTIVVKASTAASTVSATAIAFKYRLADTYATEPYGYAAITQATTTGVALGVSDDGGLLLIDIDPADVLAEGTDKRFIHALVTPGGEATACVVGAVAYLEPRYQQNEQISSIRST